MAPPFRAFVLPRTGTKARTASLSSLALCLRDGKRLEPHGPTPMGGDVMSGPKAQGATPGKGLTPQACG